MLIATLAAHPTMVETEEIKPSPPSLRCTIRVLACLSCRPISARINRSASRASSASRRL
jgi:hypothetical protein